MNDSAVIVNEFGEIGLDHLLIAPVRGEIAVMANGCICCTVRSDLEEALRGLLAGRDSGEVPHFSRVLIETTGLADPAPIVQMLLNNPLVSHFARLDAVVTTVDAVHGAAQLDTHREAVKQVAIADRLLLTKTDLTNGADPASRAGADLVSKLRALNPAAPVLPVRDGAVDPADLFGAALFDPAMKTADARRWLKEEAYHDHAHHDRHAHGIEAFCLAFDQPVDWTKVSAWLAALRHSRGEALLRVKGILALQDEENPVVIHGVHHVFHPPVCLPGWPDDDHRSRIVFITQGLGRAELLEAAEAFGVTAPMR